MSGIRQYVLLVEDDQTISAALVRELESWAKRHTIEILQASTVKEGLSLVDSYGDDIYIAITELRMPDMPGSGFLAKLSLTHPHIVTFLLSGIPDIDEIVKSLHANLFGLISKPWDSWNLRIELMSSAAKETSPRARLLPLHEAS
jgi:DNA-binding NtrC family response regulator